MKRISIVSTLILCLVVSACASPAQSSTATQAIVKAQTTPGAADPRGTGELPQSMKLAFGTLKLEGTSQAVNAEQAAQLLPLWKAVRSLNKSQTAAAQEVQGLFNQIEKAMTPEQIAAIDALQLSRENLAQIGQELGINMGGPLGNRDPTMQTTMEAVRATRAAGGETAGGGPGGGFGGPPPGVMISPGGGPGMDGPGGAGSGLSEEARATAMALRAASGAQVGIPPALLEAIIKMLEAK